MAHGLDDALSKLARLLHHREQSLPFRLNMFEIRDIRESDYNTVDDIGERPVRPDVHDPPEVALGPAHLRFMRGERA